MGNTIRKLACALPGPVERTSQNREDEVGHLDRPRRVFKDASAAAAAVSSESTAVSEKGADGEPGRTAQVDVPAISKALAAGVPVVDVIDLLTMTMKHKKIEDTRIRLSTL